MNENEDIQDHSPKVDDRLEAVRDLLFGQNVQEYRGDIKETRDLIHHQVNQVDERAAELESRINARIDDLEQKVFAHIDKTAEKINDRLDKLQNDKVDRKKLANYLVGIANKLDA